MEENKTNQIDEDYDNIFSTYFAMINKLRKESLARRSVALSRLEKLTSDLEVLNPSVKLDLSGDLKVPSVPPSYGPADSDSYRFITENFDAFQAAKIRKQIGTQDHVGSMVGMSGKYISAIETGKKKLSLGSEMGRCYVSFLVSNGYEDN
jgi:hypothetical protein